MTNNCRSTIPFYLTTKLAKNYFLNSGEIIPIIYNITYDSTFDIKAIKIVDQLFPNAELIFNITNNNICLYQSQAITIQLVNEYKVTDIDLLNKKIASSASMIIYFNNDTYLTTSPVIETLTYGNSNLFGIITVNQSFPPVFSLNLLNTGPSRAKNIKITIPYPSDILNKDEITLITNGNNMIVTDTDIICSLESLDVNQSKKFSFSLIIDKYYLKGQIMADTYITNNNIDYSYQSTILTPNTVTSIPSIKLSYWMQWTVNLPTGVTIKEYGLFFGPKSTVFSLKEPFASLYSYDNITVGPELFITNPAQIVEGSIRRLSSDNTQITFDVGSSLWNNYNFIFILVYTIDGKNYYYTVNLDDNKNFHDFNTYYISGIFSSMKSLMWDITLINKLYNLNSTVTNYNLGSTSSLCQALNISAMCGLGGCRYIDPFNP